MKNTAVALVAFMFASVLSFAQNNESQESIKYSNITEFGFFTASPRSFSFEATTVQGFSFDKQHCIGLGIGIGTNTCVSYQYGDATTYMPVFVNYRFYFKPDRKRSPHFNVALGGVVIDEGGGFYSALTSGFRAGKFSFSSGLSFMAVLRHEVGGYYEWGGYHEFDTYDWHFPFGIVLKCGFTF